MNVELLPKRCKEAYRELLLAMRVGELMYELMNAN
jgi:hypothetical protein